MNKIKEDSLLLILQWNLKNPKSVKQEQKKCESIFITDHYF